MYDYLDLTCNNEFALPKHKSLMTSEVPFATGFEFKITATSYPMWSWPTLTKKSMQELNAITSRLYALQKF